MKLRGIAIALSLLLATGFAHALPKDKAKAVAAPPVDPESATGMENAKVGDPEALITVFFALGSAQLTATAIGWLNDAVLILKDKSGTITVGGHTDALGEAALNQDLSNRRATAVRNYLVAHGIPADRLHAVGYGKNHPIDSNETEDGRMHNRRVELKTAAAE